MKNTIKPFATFSVEVKEHGLKTCLTNLDRLKLIEQENGVWCWAAIAEMLREFYCNDDVSQEAIVERMLNCKCNDYNCACETEWVLEEVLQSLCHFEAKGPGIPSPATVEKEFRAGRPICLRMNPTQRDDSDLSGHFVILTCVSDNFIWVYDPWSWADCYPRTSSEHLGGGSFRLWTDHFLTKLGSCRWPEPGDCS